MYYEGDRRESLKPGTQLGPDHDGIVHEVTTVSYDLTTNRTKISTRKIQASDGSRLRFSGGSDGAH